MTKNPGLSPHARRPLPSRPVAGPASVCAVLLTASACAAAGTDDTDTIADSASEPPSEPRTLSVIGGGDVLVHESVWTQAEADGGGTYDFAPMFDDVSGRLHGADLALCHLEVPLGPEEGPFSGYPVFSAPPHLAQGLADAGYDGCSTASNHTFDQGEDGVVRTLDAMEEAGLGAAGSARTEEEAAEPTVHQVDAGAGDAVPVAHLSYTYGFNGFEAPEGKEWMADLIDEEAILDEAARAREAGAEIVVLSLHWGTEYSHEVDADQRELVDLADSSDIDMVLGHHAHVVQPMDLVEDTWVAYGLGNQIAGQSSPPIDSRREGVMAQVEFTETEPGTWEAGGLQAVPTWVEVEPDYRVVDLASAVEDDGERSADELSVLEQAYARIGGHLDGEGVSGQEGFQLVE
ncbi:CapA family protein [Nocardiopsis salina]|uniref:CapA family protein n=1 Tax=Nocardiopsis salina TaxID=245836 RepID=UPI0009FFF2C9|nr:CapA family protein [Nocardiopsis salina]